MRRIGNLVVALLFAGVTFLCTVYPWPADAATCTPPVAVAVSVQGMARMLHEHGGEWHPVRRHDGFCPGDILQVMERSRVDLLLMNETTLRIDQNSEIRFSAPEKELESWVDILLGGAYFMSRTPRRFRVGTPFVNAGVEGTEFFVRVDREKASVTVFEGRVSAANERGSIALGRGQTAVASAGQAPILRVIAHPRDAVQWALYYPVVIEPRAGAPKGWPEQVSELLSVGRIDEASALIDQTLKSTPADSDALALKAVIDVARNEKASALELGRKAVAANPKSAAAWIALSYAQQAQFDLDGALASLRDAVLAEPGNALARARLAEILLSFGRLDEALKEAKEAASRNPEVARTQTVLGFAYLAQVNVQEAKAAFERAIELDQADPLPRLGLGLAEIREGGLEKGRKEIEVAASLDPNNALIRSYLGKAYYEEKRARTASSQFSMAKELDPTDPTAYFYDAILKQSVNRPVEALGDMQKAISLNDNRAVYRSRLLLDEDLAARSASLGSIYNDLGFQVLGLVEGWKSVNTDPSNYSAHRLLADSYWALPRHEIARVSELLQSQLLQPININPLQPILGQKSLFFLEGAGPSSPSFNEFNPLFNRNRLALQASGLVGSNGTWGGEAVQSAVAGKLSYSVGLFGFQTDGFRPNNDLDQHIFDGFAQASLSYNTSVQGEFRYTTRENGDLTLGFDPNSFYPGLRQEIEDKSMRLGGQHVFSPSSRIIANAVYEDNKLVDTTTDQIPGEFEITVQNAFPEKIYSFELQHLLSKARFSTVTGAGWIKVDRGDDLTVEVTYPPPIPPDQFSQQFNSDINHINLYLYSEIHYPKNVTWTVGASADFVNDTKDNQSDRNQFNPKLGVVWTPLPGTTFRAAAFRVLTRTLVSTGQTIEPTQVAGFNQFFDDVGGTDSWRYGAAVDQRFSDAVYGGLEYSQRDLDVPIMFSTDTAPPAVEKFESKERLGRAYLYWTPHRWVALSGEYQYERIDNQNEAIAGDYTFLKTQRVPLGVAFFHPCGWIARARGTYYRQETNPGSDQFWIFDGSIGYRLPKRFGLATIEARNLFDQKFNYRDPDPGNPSLIPGRAVYFRLTISL